MSSNLPLHNLHSKALQKHLPGKVGSSALGQTPDLKKDSQRLKHAINCLDVTHFSVIIQISKSQQQSSAERDSMKVIT